MKCSKTSLHHCSCQFLPLYSAKGELNLKLMLFTFDWFCRTTSKRKYMLSRLSCLNCSVGVPRSLNKTSQNQCTLSVTCWVHRRLDDEPRVTESEWLASLDFC